MKIVSPADTGHYGLFGNALRIFKAVLPGLIVNAVIKRSSKGCFSFFLSGAASEYGQQIRVVSEAQAGFEPAPGGKPDTVAVLTELSVDRADKSDTAFPARNVHIDGGTVAVDGKVFLHRGKQLNKLRTKHTVGNASDFLSKTDGHHLDKAHVQRPAFS